MKIFSFDPADYVEEYRAKEFVHIKNGISEEFYEVLRDFADRSFGEHKVEGRAIGGKKEQSLYEFPESVDFPGELFDVVATVAGLNRSTMTLSERHIKAYDPDADPEPPAHKDRYASQVSMGLSIDIPADSRLVLYPFDYREVNPFNVSAALRNSLEPDQLPEVILKTARAVEIDDSARDVMMFAGSAMWHLRRRAAGAINLYLKMNDFNSDPLGEDPSTSERRARTLELLADGTGDGVATLVPVLGRRFDTVARQYTRNAWQPVLQADVWGEEPFGVTEPQFEILQAVDGERSVSRLSDDLASDGRDPEAVRRDLRRLAERGALELLTEAETQSAASARTSQAVRQPAST